MAFVITAAQQAHRDIFPALVTYYLEAGVGSCLGVVFVKVPRYPS